MALGDFQYQGGGLYVSLLNVAVFNLIKKCWIAPGRGFKSAVRKVHFVSVTEPYYVCLKKHTKLLKNQGG